MMTTAVNTTDTFATKVSVTSARHNPAGSNPWHCPKTVKQDEDGESYTRLKQRLASVPTQSRHSRQALYIDLWTGQHWLGLALSGPAPAEWLKPVSSDTAGSIAQGGSTHFKARC